MAQAYEATLHDDRIVEQSPRRLLVVADSETEAKKIVEERFPLTGRLDVSLLPSGMVVPMPLSPHVGPD